MKSNLRKKLRRKNRVRRQQNSIRGMQVEQLEDRRLLTTWHEGLGLGAAEGEGGDNYRQGEVLLAFRPGLNQTQKEAFLAENNATLEHEFQYSRSALVSLPDELSVPQAISQFQSDDRISLVEPNIVWQVDKLVPNDTYFGFQWGLDNEGQYVPSVPDADIDGPEAWEEFGTGLDNVVIAIVDTGVDYAHEDLFQNMWVNPGEIAGNSIDDDGNGYVDDVYGIDPGDNDTDPMDQDGHGTHVAGISAAQGNNGIGVTGVNWDAQIMALRVCTPGCAVSASLTAIDYMTDMKVRYGVNVVSANHSYGGPGASQFIQDAMTASINAGIVHVAAAGNDGTNNDAIPQFPASYPMDGLITVAATDPNDAKAGFSNYGAVSVDIGAPGVAIFSTTPNHGYDYNQGTSMAAPHVAGAVGYLKSIAPELSVSDTVNLLYLGADPITSMQGFTTTGGRLNIQKSAKLLEFSEFSGRVWADVNADANQDSMESGLSGWNVYLDMNNNSTLDGGEPSTPSGSDGDYTISAFIDPGTYSIRTEQRANYNQTYPSGDGSHTVTIGVRGESFEDLDFGFQGSPGEISGVKFNDMNGNGIQEDTEPGISGIYIYADLDQSGSIALGEPAAVTAEDGSYTLYGVPAATIQVREVLPPGWLQTAPGIPEYHTVDISPGDVVTNIDFGNQRAVDFGDAPAPYPTLEADGGAWHGLIRGFALGEIVDTEPDGLPQEEALGDDRNISADEDGITFPAPLFAALGGTVDVTVTIGDNPAGVLQGWVDFNSDGDWDDAGEQIISDLLLVEGDHSIDVVVPADTTIGTTFARFRYGYERGIGPTGGARAGEVEDHQVLVLADEPNATDDSYQVDQDSNNNELLVLTNDFASSAGNLRILSVATPDQNGFVTITPDGQKLVYSPAPNFASPPFETFQYTITDDSGATDTATVSINVSPSFQDPIAVDDAVYVQMDTVNNIIDVLVNDVPGADGPLTLVSVTAPSTGTAVIAGEVIRYTPQQTFSSIDQFEYTVSNTMGVLSTATVTVFEEPEPNKDVIITIEPVDDTGMLITQVGTGQFFDLKVSVKDNRSLPSGTAGVAAVYFDVLYDRRLASVVSDGTNSLGFAIDFDPNYDEIKSGVANVPGIIDEVGAFQSGFDPLGPNKIEVFTVRMRANVAGNLEFIGDPADITPNHDILTFQPPAAVAPALVSYGAYTLMVKDSTPSGGNGGGDPSGEDPFDVNGDGTLSPIDVLLVINHLNNNNNGSGEGENPNFDLDVNDDGRVTPIDALVLINELNLRGQGEGESSIQSGQSFEGMSVLDAVESYKSDLVTAPTAADSSRSFASEIDARDYLLQVGLPQSRSNRANDLENINDHELEELLEVVADDIDHAWN